MPLMNTTSDNIFYGQEPRTLSSLQFTECQKYLLCFSKANLSRMVTDVCRLTFLVNIK